MTAVSTTPPFHADHVGSLLRPASLIAAREAWMAGRLPADALRAEEDTAIADAVALQERVGLQAITDGEMRRSGWRDAFFDAVDGFDTAQVDNSFFFTLDDGAINRGKSVPKVVRKISKRGALVADQFRALRQLTRGTAKTTLPSPSVNHFYCGDAMLASSPYRDREEYFDDIVAIYREEIADLAASGCTYLQIDDVPLAVLCDPRNIQIARARGDDPERLIDSYVDLHNRAVKDRPATMTLCVHLCRGNIGQGLASGGYEPVAERLFQQMDADGFFLEYDTNRAGDFSPLRFMPKTRRVVLGLMSTKTPALEPQDALRRKVDDATKYVDLAQLGLSHQCGFSSVFNTRRLTVDQEERKLAHMVTVAGRIWG
jgi:5-methyltetrahydropteroyltriglutamate--homocysteine methyltransferase